MLSYSDFHVNKPWITVFKLALKTIDNWYKTIQIGNALFHGKRRKLCQNQLMIHVDVPILVQGTGIAEPARSTTVKTAHEPIAARMVPRRRKRS